MCQCTLCGKFLDHEITYEFNYYYGSGINRKCDENNNQNIKTYKTMDLFCEQCVDMILDVELDVGKKQFKTNMNILYENKVSEEEAKDPPCFLCQRNNLMNYYGICFEKTFYSESVNEICDTYFLGAVCVDCHQTILKKHNKSTWQANLRYSFKNNKFNRNLYYSAEYPAILD